MTAMDRLLILVRRFIKIGKCQREREGKEKEKEGGWKDGKMMKYLR